jgi:hypothetical protein
MVSNYLEAMNTAVEDTKSLAMNTAVEDTELSSKIVVFLQFWKLTPDLF